ncbi:MAG: hypothetical protein M3N47_09340 [Chloroflexota bacterium]|nr:hypothetical protein [Chloroflexota bacterium]
MPDEPKGADLEGSAAGSASAELRIEVRLISDADTVLATESATIVGAGSLQATAARLTGIGRALAEELAAPEAESARKPRRKQGDLPKLLPQQTFQEMRNVGIGLADGPSGRRWVEVEGEPAMFHAVDGQPIHVRFSPSSLLLTLWNEPAAYAQLRAELKQAGAPAVLLAHVVVGLVIEQGEVTIALDDLRRLIGWKRREAALIDEQRHRVWRMLLLIESLKVIGKRPGTYNDPRTRQVIDTAGRDPLIVVRGARYATGPSTGQDVPIDVTIIAGAWIDEHRGNRQVLTDFGDVLKLANIPAGQPAGAWAQSVGLALNQRWRERAARADIARVGEDAHTTVRFGQHFTRRDLLEMFRAEPYYQDVLGGPNPSRARKHWDDAIKLLKGAGVIGYYAEVEQLPAGRQGWQAAWLAQPLDIRPTEDGRRDAAEIKRAAIVAAAKAKRPHRRAKA